MNQSPYNEPYNITTVPPWKSPEPEPPAPAKLSPRAKAGLGLGFACVAAAGMFTWSQYESAQADAQVRQAQIALDAAKVDLAQQQQAAAQAQAAGQETPAQKARRLAVEACIATAGSNYGAVSDCGQIYPVTSSPALSDASSTASTSNGPGSGSDVGLIVLGSVGAVLAVGWAKKRLPARSS
jgi:hypothetical protein